jgi:ABC-type polysaccharide/polyol phosphate transport system ATPase subunit
MSGSLAPTKGRISIHGRVLSLLGGPDATLEPHLTGKENIMNLGVSLGENRNAMKLKLEEIIEFSGLGARIVTPVATYSSGMASRLRFATITALSPQVLIVDEGIGSTADQDFVRRARDRLMRFQRRIEIIAWSSHNAGLGEIETRRFELSQGVLHEKSSC